ncbi:MAG: trypsin-like serine protease [Rhizobiales bacterium]|nr:trypsin-like serine protease [Hyphomicrobiales bacterium]
MRKTTAFALAALLASGAYASAADNSAGKEATVTEGTRDAGAAVTLKPAKAVPKIEADRSASRDVITDPAAAAKSFTFVGRSSDGKMVNVAPGDAVVKALTGEKAAEGSRAPLAEGQGEDPETGDEEGSRQIVGKDERAQVYNTLRAPYPTIGYLEMADSSGQQYSCTAALIGPSTILTAAQCLYNHQNPDDPWRDKFVFWPGLGGEKNIPFQGVAYDTAYVAQGFIDNYTDNYDSVWQYDLGIVTLQEPIGNSVGWMGYWAFPNMGKFTANVVGYPYDKEGFTMWRSACDVKPDEVGDYDIAYTCDVTDGMVGAPIYIYDQETKSRYIIGVNIGDFGEKNWGLRMYQALFEWIQTVNK